MRKKEFNEVVDSLIRQVTAEIEASRDELLTAYETFMESGGLSIFMGAKLQKNGKASDQVLVLCNISFPKDKYKDSSKEVIHLGQTSLPLENPEEDVEVREPVDGEIVDDDPLGVNSETPLPGIADQEELPPATHNIKAGKGFSVKVGSLRDHAGFKWYAEINFPDGGQEHDGAYDSSETYEDGRVAETAGLEFVIAQLDAAKKSNGFSQDDKKKVSKGRRLLEDALALSRQPAEG